MKTAAKISLLSIPVVFGVAGAALQPAASVAKESLVPLFDTNTKLEPETVIDTPTALITRWSDRVRDRHARENMFHAYNHFVALYWEKRTVNLEIVDRIAKGGDSITYNMTSLAPLNKPNLRLFFEGKGTVAQYTDNTISVQTDPLHYTQTVKFNTNEHRPIKIGDRIETEFSPFLLPPVEGRTNYYGTAFLYVVGKGLIPWEGHGKLRDSYPIPEEAWEGGKTTVHEPNSDEPKELYKQMATNIAWTNAQPFVLGRRLFHTDFATGNHTEPGNPVFKEQTGKLGPRFQEHSCVACHANDGKSLPSDAGKPMNQYAIHVGSDATGTPDPNLGYMLQGNSVSGPVEGSIKISSWTESTTTLADGTKVSLRKPTYAFTGNVPKFYSPRLPPQLVGMGLIEALDEKEIIAGAEKSGKPEGVKGKVQLVTDPESGDTHIGRFGWKAGQDTLKHQIAGAFANDMGVTSPVYPSGDRGSNQPELPKDTKLNAKDLDDVYRYVATLGMNPQKNYADEDVKKGAKVFASTDCVACHTDTLHTSAYHPFAELRKQTVHPYSDFLLHDMGAGLADNMGEGKATGSEWRTTPLWSLGNIAGPAGGEVYLHDGRARSLTEAIMWHAGEADQSKEKFSKLSTEDREALLKFLKSL